MQTFTIENKETCLYSIIKIIDFSESKILNNDVRQLILVVFSNKNNEIFDNLLHFKERQI